jgi:hypothetical protein
MRTYLLMGVAALSLTACKLDRSPTAPGNAQFSAAAPFDLGLAPGYDALPYAQSLPVSYAPQPVAQGYWDQAYSQGQTYYDQPPGYFPYLGATPLVWGQGDMITRIVEALVGGGQREYYYQPGSDYPFFVRDPQYAYAYDDRQLVAMYDPYGRPLQETIVYERAPIAARYLTRAETLYDVASRTGVRPLTPKVWTIERDRLARDTDNDGWKRWWTPGDNRSPVATQRLAEVRARKAERDLAHDEWKAKAAADRDERHALKAAEHPQYRAMAAPPGKRVHAVIPAAERRPEAPKPHADVRPVKAERAPAAVDHARPAAFKAKAKAKAAAQAKSKAAREERDTKRD